MAQENSFEDIVLLLKTKVPEDVLEKISQETIKKLLDDYIKDVFV